MPFNAGRPRAGKKLFELFHYRDITKMFPVLIKWDKKKEPRKTSQTDKPEETERERRQREEDESNTSCCVISQKQQKIIVKVKLSKIYNDERNEKISANKFFANKTEEKSLKNKKFLG